MIPLPSGTKVWLATGHTDMRKGIGGLSLLVQEVLGRDPFCGHLFVFRGRRSATRAMAQPSSRAIRLGEPRGSLPAQPRPAW